MPAHIRTVLSGATLSIPVIVGRMALGTWQSILLVDPNADNPSRKVRFSFVPG